MTLAETSRIDIVAESPEGQIVLAIVAAGGWDDVTARRDELVRKLGTYIDYMHSPEYDAKFGAKEPVVHVITQADPPPEITELLRATEAASGIPIQVQRLGTGGEPRPVGEASPPEPPSRVEAPPVARAPDPVEMPSEPVPAGSAGPSLEEILAMLPQGGGAEPVPDGERLRTVRQVFGLFGLLGGVAAGVFAWSRAGSIALALFVFAMVNHIISRGIADVITDPQKVRRAFYFLLAPALSTGVLWLVWRQWGIMWLAALVGFFGGLMLNAILAPRLFPRIALEEQADSAERMKEAFGKGRGAGDRPSG